MAIAELKRVTAPLAKARNGTTTPNRGYHGVPVLLLHVDDPIPTPRAPERYAVQVTPDLARYLLTFNHAENRRLRDRNVKKIAADMRAGRYAFTPESVVFSVTSVLQNGQNRLMAVTEYGEPVWQMFDFGWPDDIITAIDRGSARTLQDTMHVAGLANASQLASVITKVWHYEHSVGAARQWSGLPSPSSREALSIAEADRDGWMRAVLAATRTYRALDKGMSVSGWGACYYLFARVNAAEAERFFLEIAEGTGAPHSPTRKIADWFRRRPYSVTKTGDTREPIEIVIRAFNAWSGGAVFAFPKYQGFPLSRVRGAK